MLRFSLSPTVDMHICSLRIAIFNALLSRQQNEPLVIRIEDLDAERNNEGKKKEIQQILGLFSIEYLDVIHQSANLRFHRAMAIQLLQEKKAFNCFCTPEELDKKRALAKQQHRPFRYDDTCTHLPPEETIDNENPFTVRLKRPEAPVKVDDIVKGSVTFDPMDIDSFIILRAEKIPTYNFACAIDDMLSDISLVVRGEEHFDDTPRQIAVREALGYDKKIEYAHLPAILNDDGNQDQTSVKWLLEQGFLPEAIANYLISLGNRTPTEIFTLGEAVDWFDLKTISTTPATFSMDTLRSINREHLKHMDDKELSRYVGFADDAIGKLAKLYLEEAGTTRELKAKIDAVFGQKKIPDAYAARVGSIRKVLHSAPYFDTFEALLKHLAEQTGMDETQLQTPLRLLLTGSEHGPETADIYACIKSYLGEIVK